MSSSSFLVRWMVVSSRVQDLVFACFQGCLFARMLSNMLHVQGIVVCVGLLESGARVPEGPRAGVCLFG